MYLKSKTLCGITCILYKYMTQDIKKIILLIGDIAIFYASLWIGLTIRKLEFITTDVMADHVPAFSVVLIFWIIVFYINDLYLVSRSRNASERMNSIITSMLINTALAAVFFYVTQNIWSIKPQTILILSSLIFTILLYMYRAIMERFYGSTTFHNGVLFVGINEISNELITYIKNHNQLGYSVKAIIDETAKDNNSIPTYNVNDSVFNTVLNKHDIQTVVISLHIYENPKITSSLYNVLNPNIRIVNLPRFYEEVTGKIPVNQIGQAWVLENFASETKRMFDVIKRFFDIIISLILGFFSILLLPFVALVIILDSGFPIFFKQTRVGYMGKKFLAIKYRSMKQDAEKHGAQWAQKNDSRVTRVGKFLRKSRIDELPQLWNILKGDMSLIGSRPERPVFVEELTKEIPFYKERLLIKPGLSGWAQVMGPAYGGSKEETLEKLQYDLYYLKNRSLGLDLAITLKTIKTIVSRKGQ